jgi:hypothetical protein
MKVEFSMPRSEIMRLVLDQFQDRPRNELEEVIEGVQNTALPDVNLTEIKSAVLGLLRRHKLELTDDFALQRPR